MEKDLEKHGLLANPELIVAKAKNVRDIVRLENIRSIGDSEEVEMGDCLRLEDNGKVTSFNYGSIFCVSGVIKTVDNEYYAFQSVVDSFSKEQQELLKKAVDGFVGGGAEALKMLGSTLQEYNVKVLAPPAEGYDFNMVIVKDRNGYKTQPGFYYCYEKEEPVFMENMAIAMDESRQCFLDHPSF